MITPKRMCPPYLLRPATTTATPGSHAESATPTTDWAEFVDVARIAGKVEILAEERISRCTGCRQIVDAQEARPIAEPAPRSAATWWDPRFLSITDGQAWIPDGVSSSDLGRARRANRLRVGRVRRRGVRILR